MLGTRRRIALLAGVAAVVGAAALAIIVWRQTTIDHPPIDADDSAQVAAGQAIYGAQCARCHGAKLEGQPNWQQRQANGRLPAPPHDKTGHTWHHPDDVLFALVKHGLVPPLAPEDYQSDMPGFEGVLTDEEIAAVLAYIESTWPSEIRDRQRRVTEQARSQR